MKKQQRFRIEGMHCGGCAMAIDDALDGLAGVVKSKTSFRKERTDVVLDDEAVELDTIRQAMAELGYRAD